MLSDSHFFFNKAADVLRLQDKVRQILLNPRRSIKAEIVIEDSNGELQHYTGYRVQHNFARGPMKGGLRFHPEVDFDEVRSLASLVTKSVRSCRSTICTTPGLQSSTLYQPWL